ncbi:MAG: hypothetical protein ACT4O1_12955 [Gemmatimonadota bacterium]
METIPEVYGLSRGLQLEAEVGMKLGGVVLISLLLGSCASAGTSGPQVQLPIRINNNLIPPSSLTIFLVPASGIEHNLGDVIGSGQHQLMFRGLPPSGEYQLVARRSDGRAMASRVIVLDQNVTAIHWDLQQNFLELTIAER